MTAHRSESIFRIDTFRCPTKHIQAFTDRLAIIHRHFDTLDGCLYNRVVVSPGQEEVKVATVVEWRDAAAMAGAKAAVSKIYAKEDFDPQAFMAGLGITSEMASYRDVAALQMASASPA